MSWEKTYQQRNIVSARNRSEAIKDGDTVHGGDLWSTDIPKQNLWEKSQTMEKSHSNSALKSTLMPLDRKPSYLGHLEVVPFFLGQPSRRRE